jgi:glycosyltransferase involved in cell wall biosynthesis
MILIFIKRIKEYLARGKVFVGLTSEHHSYPKKALLYYKTGGFLISGKFNYNHTNEWEVFKIVEILNSLGYSVDVVDRGVLNFSPSDNYDMFIGLAAGDSGKFFLKYANLVPNAVKIALCAGPEPSLSAKLVSESYVNFNIQHQCNVPTMRVPTIDFNSFVEKSDALLVIGESDTFCPNSYMKHDKPIYTYLPGCSPKIRFIDEWIFQRDLKRFVCFAGNGFICKGVDILIDSFCRHPELSLHICGPDNESGFFEIYDQVIENSPNIHYEGFVEVGSKKFEELCSSCGYVAFNSSAEGCTTSVATMMIAGLVPIINYETGINIKSFGIEIENSGNKIDSTEKAILQAASMSRREYRDCVYKTLEDSIKYTQESFTTSFKMSLTKIIRNQKNNG